MIWLWTGFIALVVVLLALDLMVFHRHAHVARMREALGWSAVWLSIGLLFSVFVYYAYRGQWLGLGQSVDPVDGAVLDGATAAVKYLTGYVVEESLSVDNLFVIAMIFGSFGVPTIHRRRVLFWGILGALVLRGLMIGIGAGLIANFHWILYVFGGFLIVTGIRMLVVHGERTDPSQNAVARLARRFLPLTDQFYGERFTVRAPRANTAGGGAADASWPIDAALARARPGALLFTPMALALIVVESADLVFAVDSIPAVFAITGDPFLVFTSNVFAILGLRSLYFALEGMINKFKYLQVALAVVLTVVGVKMLTAEWLRHVFGSRVNVYLLGLVAAIIGTGVVLSLVSDRASRKRGPCG